MNEGGVNKIVLGTTGQETQAYPRPTLGHLPWKHGEQGMSEAQNAHDPPSVGVRGLRMPPELLYFQGWARPRGLGN